MLYASLILSALLLLIANVIARRGRDVWALIVVTGLGFLLLPCFLSPPLILQDLLLFGCLIAWRASGRGPATFLKLSCGVTLAAYAVSGLLVVQSELEYARLRRLYPYESMEARLPSRGPVSAGPDLPVDTARRLARLEGELGDRSNGFREFQLRMLHEKALGLFINSPGFGSTRMIRPSAAGLAVNQRRGPVPPQPAPGIALAWSPGDREPAPEGEDSPTGSLHEASFLDFVNAPGFGLFKDRRHVAGFETHRFSRVPEPSGRWSVRTLELMSLLLHDEPAVYVSDHLPRMEEHHDMPTRPLDRFEGYGLAALKRGDDLFISRAGDGLRMLGAVRSIARCVDCHGGARGDLLGAFSYTLRYEGPSTSGEGPPAAVAGRVEGEGVRLTPGSRDEGSTGKAGDPPGPTPGDLQDGDREPERDQ